MSNAQDRALETKRLGFTVRERTGRKKPNANGYFVQRDGITVDGPFATLSEAWRAADERAYWGDGR